MIALRPRRSVAAAAAAWLCLLVLAPGSVLGHAELDTVTPTDKSTVPAPSQIVMTFTENLDASGSNIRLVDSSGAVVAQGGTVDSANAKQMTLALSNLAPGGYTIRWTSKSAVDGDIARGTTTFTATAATPAPPSASPSAEPSTAVDRTERRRYGLPTASAAPSDSPIASGDTSGRFDELDGHHRFPIVSGSPSSPARWWIAGGVGART
jgi:methionine-rich copper-binding protein CopC